MHQIYVSSLSYGGRPHMSLLHRSGSHYIRSMVYFFWLKAICYHVIIIFVVVLSCHNN